MQCAYAWWPLAPGCLGCVSAVLRDQSLQHCVLRQVLGHRHGQDARQSLEPLFLLGKVSRWQKGACIRRELSAQWFWHLPGKGKQQQHRTGGTSQQVSSTLPGPHYTWLIPSHLLRADKVSHFTQPIPSVCTHQPS